MKIIDTHCDALYKLQQHPTVDFLKGDLLDTNLLRLKAGKISVQFFAIFLEPNIPSNQAWLKTIEQIEIFQSKIIASDSSIVHVKNWQQINELKEDEIGAVLTLEGAESFGNDLLKLSYLYEAGVLSIGLTWNQANLCADGSGEPRGAGLTLLGKNVVQLNNRHKVLTDVSHLSEKAFWDVMGLAEYPFASHSNAKKICNHPRNLTDSQIKALIKKQSQIQLVFYPEFINSKSTATIKDIILHIEHICSLGGEKHIGFGSDFDGIDQYITGLENASKYSYLVEELSMHYTNNQVHNFLSNNFHRFLAAKNLFI